MIQDGYAREIIDEAVSIVSSDQPYARLLTWIEDSDSLGIGFHATTYTIIYNPDHIRESSMNRLCDVISAVVTRMGTPCPELVINTSTTIH